MFNVIIRLMVIIHARADLELSSSVRGVWRVHVEKFGNAASDVRLDTLVFMEHQTWRDEVFSNGGERRKINILSLRLGNRCQFVKKSL